MSLGLFNYQDLFNDMSSLGLTPRPDMKVGEECRGPGVGKGPDNSACSWRLTEEGHVLYRDHSSGLSGRWTGNNRQLSPTDPAQVRRDRQHQQKQRKQLDRQRHDSQTEAQQLCHKIWAPSPAAIRHAYTTYKHVQCHGLRIQASSGCLLIPMYYQREIWNLQFIAPEPVSGKWTKRFKKSGRTKDCYFVIGKLSPETTILICEGYATGACLYEQTGYPTVISFNAGNILSVAQATRHHYPDADICICGDDDRHTPGNPGRTKAQAAALSIGARLAMPMFSQHSTGTDFNDLFLEQVA